MIGALRVEYLEGRSLRMSEHSHHTLFQTSTIEALLGGNYEGDVAFADWIAPIRGWENAGG